MLSSLLAKYLANHLSKNVLTNVFPKFEFLILLHIYPLKTKTKTKSSCNCGVTHQVDLKVLLTSKQTFWFSIKSLRKTQL